MSGSGKAKGRPASPRELALNVLTEVEQEGAYSNLLLNAALQKASLSRADAGLATELVYGTISRLNTLDYFLDKFVNKGVAKLQPWVRALLRLSLYQLMYLDRIPEHAAVSEAVNLAKRRGHQGISGMVNGVLRSVLRQKDELKIPDALPPARRIALRHSHPEWLAERWMLQYGEATAEAICAANNTPPAVSVRVNTTMISRDAMLEELRSHDLTAEPSALSPYGIVVQGGGNMALTEWYREGMISIQDESSMLVAEAVAPEPGMRVLDCCAAPGGKTAHMAELMKDEGEIVANDIHTHKGKLIREQVARLGLDCVTTITGDALELSSRFEPASFDRILLDAPCSGLGVIRRKPDLKWGKSPEDIAEIAALQRRLLHTAAELLRLGGLLVYSTCTIEPAENEEAVADFLADRADFALAEDALGPLSRLREAALVRGGGIQILPQHFHSDGFYIARLRKLP
ncbi:16S rRNA (cytosine(967)-C(5))-methyltransferase RsmB [Paenibacillus sp. FSL M8-0334]|uniref:16S rRNA (cytosine(967)-C(5))-methyltransferase n=1 Tax=Paenibacillus campinasensis TaxID=66347 RepID=A0ABW9SWU7_9BACL|nr:16S rRNA (cytosine(967)-C(5))-methyltransferase RsmB [Paenibacillus campinasensis]MUG64796.1 16S rRNA (cytosine(967)-C(5))-methyltransferase RsmB [Paenibacillus campinasensis]